MGFDVKRFLMEAGRTAGEVMMIRFRESWSSGKLPPDEVMQFFNDAFGEILNNKTPKAGDIKKALKLNRRRGNKVSSDSLAQEMELTKMVVCLMATGCFSRDKAIEAVASDRKVSFGTIERYYGTHKKIVRIQVWLETGSLMVKRELLPAIGLKNTEGFPFPAGYWIWAWMRWRRHPGLTAEDATNEYFEWALKDPGGIKPAEITHDELAEMFRFVATAQK